MKVSQEDELTISSLQQQAADSKTKEILANRNAQEAADMVSSLNFEINQLKRRLKIAEGDKIGSSSSTTGHEQTSYAAADAEVDAMLGLNRGAFQPTKFVDKPFVESATPFERWKMNQFIYSPDTPAASEEYDRQVVQMLLDASTQEFSQDFRKPTKAGIAKLKRVASLSHPTLLKPLTSSGPRTSLITTTEGGANVYETVGVNILGLEDVPPHSAVAGSRQGQEERIYFLDKSASGNMWGSTAKQALQRAASLGGTPGFGAGILDDFPSPSLRDSFSRPGTMATGRDNNFSRPGTMATGRSLNSPVKSHRRNDHSPSSKKTKGINSMIV